MMQKLNVFGLVGNNTRGLPYLVVAILTFGIFSCNTSTDQKDYYSLPAYNKDKNLQAVIEIPAGTNYKIEYDKIARKFLVDTILGKPRIINFLPYLGNYGFIPSTFSDPKKGGDGDALDVLILSESEPTGKILSITPIALLELSDNNQSDNKIIAVPSDEKKRIINATNFEDFSTNYPHIRKMIGMFENYDSNDDVKVIKWTGEKAALQEVNKWMINK